MKLDEALKRLTPEYLAGLIDGEGCITITAAGRNYQGRIIVEMTAQSVVEALAVRYRVLMRTPKSRTNQAGIRKASYRAEVGGEKALELALEIQPHLIDKAPQLEILIKFLRHKERRKSLEIRTMSAKTLSLYAKMKQELQDLKHKYNENS